MQLRKSARATAQSEITDEDCELFDALNEQARTVLNVGRAAYGPAFKDDDAEGISGELTSLIDELKQKMPKSPLVGELTNYRDDLQELFKQKSKILEGTAGIREKFKPIRDAVWGTSSPHAM